MAGDSPSARCSSISGLLVRVLSASCSLEDAVAMPSDEALEEAIVKAERSLTTLEQQVQAEVLISVLCPLNLRNVFSDSLRSQTPKLHHSCSI
eukprot:scaffold537_cov180-Ochromonas_danica.AAC.27